VLAPGDRVPEATVWLAPRESATVAELVQDRSALFFFFLFAWSRSQWERGRLRLNLRASAVIHGSAGRINVRRARWCPFELAPGRRHS
jgi:hypothetical protein